MILFDIFLDVAVALAGIAGGYLSALAVYFLLSWLMTLEGRRLLMSQGGMSRLYYMQTGICWTLSSAAGVVVALKIFPDMPMFMISVASVALLLCLALMRLRSKAPHQLTIADTGVLILCVLVGLAVPTYIHLT